MAAGGDQKIRQPPGPVKILINFFLKTSRDDVNSRGKIFLPKLEEYDMGFDLYGMGTRKNEVDYSDLTIGQYFRENVWGWHPLWQYLCEIARDVLSEEDMKLGRSNSGHIITKEKAIALADILKIVIADGLHLEYIRKREEELKRLPLEECPHCEGAGIRNDTYVQGECNGCDGKGERKQFATHYHLDPDSIVNFEAFARNSNGFEID